MSIAYEEMQGSPTESWSDEGFRATRKLMCAWTSRLALAQQLKLGGGQPYRYYPFARVRDVAISPGPGKVSAASGTTAYAAYDKAILTVQYSTPDADATEKVGEQLVSESLRPSAEFLTVAVKDKDEQPLFRWDSGFGDALSDQEAPGKLVRTLDYIVTRYQVTNVPASVFSLVGHVNDAPIAALLLGVTFAAETLLYNAPELQRVTTTDGVQAWDITQTFTVRETGWNKFWRASSGAFERIYHDGPGARIYNNYELADLSIL